MVPHQNSPNSATEDIESLAGQGDKETLDEVTTFPLRSPLPLPSRQRRQRRQPRRGQDSGQSSIFGNVEQFRAELPKWPGYISRAPYTPSVQSDSGYSSATTSSRQSGVTWRSSVYSRGGGVERKFSFHQNLSDFWEEPTEDTLPQRMQTDSGYLSHPWTSIHSGDSLREQNLKWPNVISLPTIAPSMQTSSDYGSISRDGPGPSQSSQIKKVIEGPLDTNMERNITGLPLPQEDDTKTQILYPEDQSMMDTKSTQRHVLRFANHLYSRLQKQLTEDSIYIITKLLPELLESFSLKLGQTSQSQIKRDAMFIIYTHQNQITQSIRALVNSKSLSREELLTSSLVAKPDEEYSIKDNFQLFEAATKDPAFEWLVKKLSNELTSTDIDSFAVKQFSSCIRDRLPRFRRINRKYPSKPYKITFDVECDIPKFIQDQGYEGSAADVVPKVITLTGSIHDVQAATCEHYLIQTWPVVGCNLLRTIQGALREEHTSETFQYSCKCKFEDRTEIKVSIGRSMKVEAIGSIPSIIEIGEQIGWLATAFKSSFQDSEISFCHPEIIRFQTEDVTGSRSIGNEFEQAFKCEVHVATDHIRDNLPSINGQCWQQIFNNPVVVTGYPIKFRDFLNSGVGLELPFDMMTTLADARYLTTFDDKTLVKGFSTTLIPTRIHGSIILWHLLVNESGARISYRDPRIQQGILIEPDRLKSARHILGWCTNALNNIGSPNASYDIGYSGLSQGRGSLSWEGIELSIGAGNYFKVGTTFTRGKKDRSVCNFVSNGYVSLVEHIGKHHIMLYDVKEKRGWLSDGLPVLLHLVRTSLRRDEKEDPYHLFTQHIEKLNESPSSVQGTTAAKAVLFDGENRLFNLHLIDTKVTEQIIERTINGDTIKEIVRIKEATHYRFENRVEEICLLLEKTIDQTAKAIKEGVLRDTPKNLLGGFDFVGVATRSQLRHITTKIPIPTHAYGWTDLVDSLEVVTLFGSDFGELIKPRVDNPSKSCNRCGYGASLPSGKNHVAVCVDVLERIIETNGNKDTTGWRLTDDLYWHFNEPAFRSCCTSLNGQRVNPKTGNWIQILSSKNIYHHPELLIPKNGMGNDAVIFGHSRPRLVRMSRNIGIKRDLLPDESILSQTSFEVSISSRPPDENSGANENQLFETVSSATPITGSSRTDRSGSESYHDLSETMSSNTPNTSNSSGRGELGSNGTTVDQQCFSSEVSERPEIIDTLPQNAPKKLPTDSPEKSFGRIKNTCARAWNKLKRHKESPDSKMRGVNQIEI